MNVRSFAGLNPNLRRYGSILSLKDIFFYLYELIETHNIIIGNQNTRKKIYFKEIKPI